MLNHILLKQLIFILFTCMCKLRQKHSEPKQLLMEVMNYLRIAKERNRVVDLLKTLKQMHK